MFLDNSYVIPLYDVQNGGPPRAFECKDCGEVFKTESGMAQHLKRKHEHEDQPCLFSMDNAKPLEAERKITDNPGFDPPRPAPYRRKVYLTPSTGMEPEVMPEVPQPNEPKKPEKI